METVRNRFIPGYKVVRTSDPIWRLLPAGDQIREVLEEAQRQAFTLRDFLVALGDFEDRMLRAEALARRAAVKGVFTPHDARTYDMLVTLLYRTELYCYDVIRWLVPAALLSQIPKPHPLPSSTQILKDASRARAAGVQGLGAAAPPVWALIVLAVLVAAVGALLMYAFTSGDEAAEQAKQAIAVGEIARQEWEGMLSARVSTYEACVAQGTSPAECAEVAQGVVPTPGEAGTVPQLLVPTSGADTLWSFVVPLGVGALVLGGVGWYLTRARKRKRGRSSLPAFDDSDDFDTSFGTGFEGARRVKRLDGPSRYYLEIKHGK